MGLKRLYRVYYTTYSDDVHRRIINEIESRYGFKVVEHPSRVHPEFRFIEIYTEREGMEEELVSLVKNIAGTMYVRVDWIFT
ncbi:MAG: hypothetical protein F7C08_01995 [Desulfurococcales archaeon]|nr:hypothetical protein [Desulfurococcales archaeon]MCE4605290.1 hypothetical protein [Desulfurococcales archaeon]